jgi:hypothetical protein
VLPCTRLPRQPGLFSLVESFWQDHLVTHLIYAARGFANHLPRYLQPMGLDLTPTVARQDLAPAMRVAMKLLQPARK